MNVLDKISTIKAIRNLVVLRSKYDKVSDELAYRELEANKLKDYINVLIDDKSYVVATLDDRFKRIETLKEVIESKDVIVEDLELRNERLVIECKELRKEKNDNHDKYLKEKYFRFLWVVAGFCGGILCWAGIVKYFSL